MRPIPVGSSASHSTLSVLAVTGAIDVLGDSVGDPGADEALALGMAGGAGEGLGVGDADAPVCAAGALHPAAINTASRMPPLPRLSAFISPSVRRVFVNDYETLGAALR